MGGDTPGCLHTRILTVSGCPAYFTECSCDAGVGADADDDDDTADGLDVGILITASGRPESASVFFDTAPRGRPRRGCGNNSTIDNDDDDDTGECDVDNSALKV